jgi:hypothetical protein
VAGDELSGLPELLVFARRREGLALLVPPVAVGGGLLAGFYPAMRAARLTPTRHCRRRDELAEELQPATPPNSSARRPREVAGPRAGGLADQVVALGDVRRPAGGFGIRGAGGRQITVELV